MSLKTITMNPINHVEDIQVTRNFKEDMIETQNFDIEKWLAKHPEEEHFKHQFLDKNPFNVLLELGIEAGDVVLDFGCGSGTYTIPAAKLVEDGGRVYALDTNSGFLDIIEERAKQEGLKNIVRIDASKEAKIPLQNEEIDVMLLIDVLHLIEDKETLLDQAYRILKLGGRIIAYPMHVPAREVEELATNRRFNLEESKFDGRFLILRKSASKHQSSAKANQKNEVVQVSSIARTNIQLCSWSG